MLSLNSSFFWDILWEFFPVFVLPYSPGLSLGRKYMKKLFSEFSNFLLTCFLPVSSNLIRLQASALSFCRRSMKVRKMPKASFLFQIAPISLIMRLCSHFRHISTFPYPNFGRHIILSFLSNIKNTLFSFYYKCFIESSFVADEIDSKFPNYISFFEVIITKLILINCTKWCHRNWSSGQLVNSLTNFKI